jgi:hypothetical protein
MESTFYGLHILKYRWVVIILVDNDYHYFKTYAS